MVNIVRKEVENTCEKCTVKEKRTNIWNKFLVQVRVGVLGALAVVRVPLSLQEAVRHPELDGVQNGWNDDHDHD